MQKFIIFLVFLFSITTVISQKTSDVDSLNNHFQIEIKENQNKINQDIENGKKKISDFNIFKNWKMGFSYGITQFGGDLRQHNHYPAYQETGDFYELKTAVAFSLHKRINSFYSISAEILSGKFSGLRRSNEYLGYTVYDPYNNYEGNGDKFNASFKEADLIANVDISNVFSYFFNSKKANKLFFNGKLGIGYNIYNSVRRNLISDTYIYSFGYKDEGSNSSGIDYGNDKKGLFTSPSETVYLYGIQAKYKLNEKLNLTLDYTVRNGETDKWDASIMNTQNLTDRFDFLSFGISYKFGHHNYSNEWESPIDNLNSSVNTIEANIIGLSLDSDHDGVSDSFDKDPNTPIGVAVDGSGIALDVDMDNVPDFIDADPFSSRGSIVDLNGVEFDSDNDGIPDSKDLESNTKAGSIVNQYGISITINNNNYNETAFLPSVYFETGSKFISSSNLKRLTTVAQIMILNPTIRINVIGNTDFTGTTESNNKLGKERAEEVVRYLVETFGIERSRCVTFSNGEAKPITTNNNTSNEFSNNYLREINRRVDFQIIY